MTNQLTETTAMNETTLYTLVFGAAGPELPDTHDPKPPSLKERALKALKVLPTPAGQVTLDITDVNTIRRALEQLND
jgi:hypothetical protein